MEIKSGSQQEEAEKWTQFSVLEVGTAQCLGQNARQPRKKGWWICEEGIHWWIPTKFEDWFPSWRGEWWADWPAGDPWEVEAPPTTSHKAHRQSKLQQGWEVPPPLPHQKQFPLLRYRPPEETNQISQVPVFTLLVNQHFPRIDSITRTGSCSATFLAVQPTAQYRWPCHSLPDWGTF